jgi:hypothetical protein
MKTPNKKLCKVGTYVIITQLTEDGDTQMQEWFHLNGMNINSLPPLIQPRLLTSINDQSGEE